SRTLHTSINGQNALLSWESLIADKKSTAKTPQNGYIIIAPKFDYAQFRPAGAAIEAVRNAISDIQDSNLPSVKVWVTGEVGLEDDEFLGMSTGTLNAGIFSIVLVIGILLIAYRSVLLSVATLVVLALGMVFCGVFATAAVKELNMVSVAFAVSNIGLGVEYAIHFCLRYRDNLLLHANKDQALQDTLVTTSPSLLLCAGTTAIGLYAFIPTDYKAVSELGLLAGTSLFICLLVTLIALPALLKILPVSFSVKASEESRPQSNALKTLSSKLALLTLHYAKPIILATLALTVLSIFLTFHVKADFNPINLRDPDTESVIAFKNLMKHKDTSPMTLTVLAKDEAETKALQQRLSALGVVDKTISLFDFVPSDQENKLAIIDEMAIMQASQTQGFPSLKPDTNPVHGILQLINKIDSILPRKTDAKEIEKLIAFKAELQDILIEIAARQEPSRRQFIEKIQTTLLGTLPSTMNKLYESLNAKPISLTDIPSEIKDRWLSKDGSYRVQIFPKKDLNDLSALEEFITEVQAIAPDTTDLPIMYWESMKEVVAAFQEAIIIALFTIALLLYLIQRNLVDTLLVMTPLLLAGLFTMACTVLTHTPINFANVVALPLLLGLGVDNGIHMVEKLRHSLSEEQNIYQSSTARAMFYGA
ncbi:MAG: MMPL family transporter, partial [Methylococcales bacterium]